MCHPLVDSGAQEKINMTFTIDSDNNITALAGLPAGAEESALFSNAKELAKLTADWPMSRLVSAWNSFAGLTPFDDLKPVKKFTSRQTAVTRLWQAVARLSPDVAPPATPVAAERAKSNMSPTQAARRAPASKGATEARPNKKAEVIAMMKRAKGATLSQIVELTGWQKHTVRGFVSLLGSKAGEKIESSKNAAEIVPTECANNQNRLFAALPCPRARRRFLF
jgi:hypothetical protein